MSASIAWRGRVLIGTVAAIVLVAVTSVPSMVSAAPVKKYSLEVSSSPSATVGVPTEFTVTMTNVTPPGTNSNPSSFYVTVPFPLSEDGITLPSDPLEGSTNPNLSATVDIDSSNASRILVRSLNAVKKNQSVKLTFTATPSSCAESPYGWVDYPEEDLDKVTNGASLNGDTFEPHSLDVETAVSCGSPALSVTKTADEPSSVAAGSTIGFTIVVTNSGAGSATGVSLTDELPTDDGLDWTIDDGTGPGCSISATLPLTLSCPIGNLAAGTSFTVGISSLTTADTVADSPVDNTATITAGNVTPDPASAGASVTVFTDAITCDENNGEGEEGGVTQGGDGTPLTTLERFDNADGSTCVPIPFNQDSDNGEEICDIGTFATQCILLQKDLLGQEEAQFMWTVVWTPEEGEYPVHPTQFDFGDGFVDLQRCLEDGDDVEGEGEPKLPELPSSDPWCIVDSSSTLNVLTGKMEVTERYYGKGDPTGRR
jgi:uncharacterized repeat protein (TIGR01451 family)